MESIYIEMADSIASEWLELIFLKVLNRNLPLVCKRWNEIISNSRVIIELARPEQSIYLPPKLWQRMHMSDKIRHSEGLLQQYYESDPFKIIEIPYYIPMWEDIVENTDYLKILFGRGYAASNRYSYFKRVFGFAHYRLYILRVCSKAVMRVDNYLLINDLPYPRADIADMIWIYLSEEFKLGIQAEINKVNKKLLI